MKKYNELNLNEKKEIVELFSYWLSNYTQEVINNVMEKSEEIINNEFAMKMLRELKERGEKEEKDFKHSIGNLLGDYETFKEYDSHNHPLTHSNSYRDILYDMYIR